MIKAKEILSPLRGGLEIPPGRRVEGGMPIVDVLPRLLDAPGRVLGVEENGEEIGLIDQTSLLEGLGRLITPRDDSSVIVVECAPTDYSASRLAHAVEDSDAHLVDLWTTPGAEGHLRVTLRVRRSDPGPTVNSLERYGYDVVEAMGAEQSNAEVALERLLSLNALLNV